MTSRDEIIKEICRMNHRILDILDNDRQINQTEPEVNTNQEAVSMMASQVVNTQPNQKQVQISQTNKVKINVINALKRIHNNNISLFLIQGFSHYCNQRR
jgi:ribosomal protein L7/L12